MSILIAAASVAFLALCIFRLDLGLALLILLLPSYQIRFGVFGIPMTFLEVMILILFGVWFIRNGKELLNNIKIVFRGIGKKGGIRDYLFKWEIVALLAISFVSVGVAGFGDSAFGIWKAYFFEPVLLYIAAFNILLRSDKRIELVIYPLSISAFAMSAFAGYQYLTGDMISNPFWAAEATRRATGFFQYPNALSLFLGPVIILSLGLALKKWQDRTKNNLIAIFFLLLCALASILGIVFAKSSGAALGLAVAFFITGMIFDRRVRAVLVAAAAIGILAIAIVPVLRGKAIERLSLEDFSGQVRKLQWKETVAMLADSPSRFLLGAGISRYKETLKPYHVDGFFYNKDNDPDFRRKIVIFDEKYKAKYWQPLEIYMYPHNIFLNFWVELGIAGLALFVWIFVKFFRTAAKLIKSGREERYVVLGLIGAMIVILVHGLVDVPYFKNDLSAIFWILLAMLSVVYTLSFPDPKGSRWDRSERGGEGNPRLAGMSR